MRSSTSSERLATERLATQPSGAAPTLRGPAATPLVRAATPGLWLKLEALQPSGHLTDRLVAELVETHLASGASELVLARLDRLALSVAQACLPAGIAVTIFYRADAVGELRLRQLTTVAGARLRRVKGDETARDAAVSAWLSQHPGARLVTGGPGAAPRAARALAEELAAQLAGRAPDAVVLPPDGAPLREALAAALPTARIEVVDAGDPAAAALREVQQRIGRSGVLVGPDGAAVCARAEALARAHQDATVIGVLPDGGQRHLGWWDGWGRPREEHAEASRRSAASSASPRQVALAVIS